MPQPTVSRHLKKLLDAGWLQKETENTTRWYSFQPALLDDVTIKSLWDVLWTDIQNQAHFFDEDLERLQSLLVLRRTNAQNFFATIVIMKMLRSLGDYCSHVIVSALRFNHC